MNTKAISRFGVVLALTVGLSGHGWTETIVIPGGTPVIVQLLEEVNSGTHKKGDKVHLSVINDVMVHGQIVIPKGSPVEGEVESASKKFFAGIGGEIAISIQNTRAVDGTVVALQFTKETHGGSSLTSIILTVVCCICFVFMQGENVKIEKDTIFNTTVVGPTEIKV